MRDFEWSHAYGLCSYSHGQNLQSSPLPFNFVWCTAARKTTQASSSPTATTCTDFLTAECDQNSYNFHTPDCVVTGADTDILLSNRSSDRASCKALWTRAPSTAQSYRVERFHAEIQCHLPSCKAPLPNTVFESGQKKEKSLKKRLYVMGQLQRVCLLHMSDLTIVDWIFMCMVHSS